MAIDRRIAGYALVFGIPPGVGMSLAVLRVGGSQAFWQAVGSGLGVGLIVAGLVVVLAVNGAAEPPTFQV